MKRNFILALALTTAFSFQLISAQNSTKPENSEVAPPPPNGIGDDYYDLAWKAYQNKDYKEALKQIDKAIQKSPSNKYYYNLKCYILIRLDDKKATLETATKGISIAPDDAAFYDIRGNTYYFLFQPDKALEDYKKMLSLDQTDARYYNNYLKLLNEMRIDRDMFTVYNTFQQQVDKKVKFKSPDFVSEVYFYASLAFQRHDDQKKMIQLLNEAIKLDDKAAVYYSNRGVAYEEIKEYKKSLEDHNKAISLQNRNPRFYSNRASVYLQLRNFELAKNDLLKALSLGDPNRDLYNNLAMASDGLKDYKSAARYYEILIKEDPKDAIALGNYGYSMLEAGDYDKAIENFTKAHQITPDEVDCLIGLSAAYFLKNNTTEQNKYLGLIKTTTKYTPDKNLLKKLSQEGYSFPDKFQRVWETMVK